MSAISEFEKVASEKEKNTQSINRLESKVSFYSSLGFNKTEKKLIKDIIVNENYKLSFYLALGDGIEASKDKKSDVTWNTSKSKEKFALPGNIESCEKYVKAPKELNLFLSQVGIVKSIEEGNKFQGDLKPGQILVSKEGALWRWDGLFIKDGTKTITYKRIMSATKLIELEKSLNDERLKIYKIVKIKNSLQKKRGKIETEIENSKKKIIDYEKLNISYNKKLTEIEKDLLVNLNKKDLKKEEIKKETNFMHEKKEEVSNLKKEKKI